MRVIASILAALSAAVALAAPASSAAISPALKQVAAAADKEGRLDLQFGVGTIGTTSQLAEMGAALNKMFGTHIAVRFTPGPSEPEMVDKIVVALRAHLPSPTDVEIGTNQYGAEMYTEQASQPIDWQALLPGRVAPQSVEADGTAIRIFTSQPGGIIYNTKLVPHKPQSLADLLQPEWKGKIASTPYAAGFELLTANDVWGSGRALDYARKLSAQVAGLIRCNELERIASGEFIAFAMNCGDRSYLDFEHDGAPIAYAVPKDFAALRYYYATLPKNAAHPNAGTLFIAFLETSEGQDWLWKTTYTDLHTYPDSHWAKVLAQYEKDGIHFQQFDITWFLKHPEALKGSKEAVAILTGH